MTENFKEKVERMRSEQEQREEHARKRRDENSRIISDKKLIDASASREMWNTAGNVTTQLKARGITTDIGILLPQDAVRYEEKRSKIRSDSIFAGSRIRDLGIFVRSHAMGAWSTDTSIRYELPYKDREGYSLTRSHSKELWLGRNGNLYVGSFSYNVSFETWGQEHRTITSANEVIIGTEIPHDDMRDRICVPLVEQGLAQLVLKYELDV
jgi:hypothetical protein